MFRISVTSLEAFRRYLDAVSPFDTREALIEKLSGAFTGNAYTAIGTAFHAVVEQGTVPVDNRPDGCRVGEEGVRMNREQVLAALAYRLSLPGAFHEVPVGKDYGTGVFPIHVSGRVDVLHGATVRDIKTKFSPVKMDDYVASCQWRLYLEMLELDEFAYDIFEFKGYKPERDGTDVRGAGLAPCETIACRRYATMEEDNRKLVEEFCRWIKDNDLFHLLKTKNNG